MTRQSSRRFNKAYQSTVYLPYHNGLLCNQATAPCSPGPGVHKEYPGAHVAQHAPELQVVHSKMYAHMLIAESSRASERATGLVAGLLLCLRQSTECACLSQAIKQADYGGRKTFKVRCTARCVENSRRSRALGSFRLQHCQANTSQYCSALRP